jgi:hypothetical protein
MEPRIMSSLQDKPIKFNYDTLAEILGISNERPGVFELKIISTL